MRLPVGSILLIIVAVLIYFGLAHRVLDRMRMTDRAALGFIVAMVVGSWWNITLTRAPVELIVNVGGGLLPLILAIYLVATADTGAERSRGVLGALVAAAAVYGAAKLIPPEPTAGMVLDPVYTFSIIAGLVAYLVGRSRRAAFIAGISAMVLNDIAHYIEITTRGIPGRTWIGGAGAFDSTIVAGLLAVGLAELIGETRERLQGGSVKEQQEKGQAGQLTGMLGYQETDLPEDALADRKSVTERKNYTWQRPGRDGERPTGEAQEDLGRGGDTLIPPPGYSTSGPDKITAPPNLHPEGSGASPSGSRPQGENGKKNFGRIGREEERP
ncbi:MAG: DUF1614 domain-containing protein [Firmicutes bacterium]|nr:DUF1614 domain-containing protein [Bacillota bacterium]